MVSAKLAPTSDGRIAAASLIMFGSDLKGGDPWTSFRGKSRVRRLAPAGEDRRLAETTTTRDAAAPGRIGTPDFSHFFTGVD